MTIHAKTNHKSAKKIYSYGLIRNLQYLKHLGSDSGANRTYHARDIYGGESAHRYQDRDSQKRNVWARPFLRIRFHPLDRRDAVSWVEMDCRKKEWSKEVSKE